MDNTTMIEVLSSRVTSLSDEVKALTSACQNLVIASTKHDEQLAVLQKILYAGAGIVGIQILANFVKLR